MPYFRVSLTDDAKSIINNHNMFKIQATGASLTDDSRVIINDRYIFMIHATGLNKFVI